MELSDIKNGDLISRYEYNSFIEEHGNCFIIITIPNYELNFDVVKIRQKYIYVKPNSNYPYGAYIETDCKLEKHFRVEMFDKKNKIKMLLCD